MGFGFRSTLVFSAPLLSAAPVSAVILNPRVRDGGSVRLRLTPTFDDVFSDRGLSDTGVRFLSLVSRRNAASTYAVSIKREVLAGSEQVDSYAYHSCAQESSFSASSKGGWRPPCRHGTNYHPRYLCSALGQNYGLVVVLKNGYPSRCVLAGKYRA